MEINNISENINFYGNKNNKNSNSNFLDFKNETKFLKCENLTIFNFNKYLNKNPEININIMNIPNKSSNNINSKGNNNNIYNDYIVLFFDKLIQIFTKNFNLIFSITIEDLNISSTSDDLLNIYSDNTIRKTDNEKEIIKEAFVYFEHLIVKSNKGNIYMIRFGFSEQIDIDYNLSDINQSKIFFLNFF